MEISLESFRQLTYKVKDIAMQRVNKTIYLNAAIPQHKTYVAVNKLRFLVKIIKIVSIGHQLTIPCK